MSYLPGLLIYLPFLKRVWISYVVHVRRHTQRKKARDKPASQSNQQMQYSAVCSSAASTSEV